MLFLISLSVHSCAYELRPQNDLLCVERDVKLYSLTHLTHMNCSFLIINAYVMPLQAHGIEYVFTLTGGHISPILVACEKIGIRVIDTRHEVCI